MIKKNKYKFLIWLLVISVAINLSAGISYMYNRQVNKSRLEAADNEKYELPAIQRTRFFREQLNLRPEQTAVFRELNRNFNRDAWQINHKLERLRIEMVTELGSGEPDTQRLERVAGEIGELHTLLKNETIGFYLDMKNECDAEQQQKLYEIFMSVLENNENVRLPQGGGRGRNMRQ